MNRIAICLPSRNEEDSIRHVTQVIDYALNEISPGCDNLIINVDSQSTDNTVSVFQQTDTFNKKLSLVSNGGKGANVYEFLKFTKDEELSCLGMFDTDLVSIKTTWLVKMHQKINSGADFVTPIYKRSPFEGSTTNHFCSPLIKSIYGIDIQQPIAGDFMFSKRFALQALDELNDNRSPCTSKYGIDIFLTLTALNNKLKVSE